MIVSTKLKIVWEQCYTSTGIGSKFYFPFETYCTRVWLPSRAKALEATQDWHVSNCPWVMFVSCLMFMCAEVSSIVQNIVCFFLYKRISLSGTHYGGFLEISTQEWAKEGIIVKAITNGASNNMLN